MTDFLSALANQWRPIYINGVLHNAKRATIGKDFDGRFFVDSDALPRRHCSQHTLRPGATDHLEAGGRIFSGGNWYSLRPPPISKG